MSSLYVWQIYDTDEQWGTISTLIPALGMTGPFVFRSREIADLMGPIAKQYAEQRNCPVRLARFVLAEVVEYDD